MTRPTVEKMNELLDELGVLAAQSQAETNAECQLMAAVVSAKGWAMQVLIEKNAEEKSS